MCLSAIAVLGRVSYLFFRIGVTVVCVNGQKRCMLFFVSFVFIVRTICQSKNACKYLHSIAHSSISNTFFSTFKFLQQSKNFEGLQGDLKCEKLKFSRMQHPAFQCLCEWMFRKEKKRKEKKYHNPEIATYSLLGSLKISLATFETRPTYQQRADDTR